MTTFLIPLLFAVIFLVAGGALLYFRGRTKQKAALMGQTSGAADVSGLAPGTPVEVKGTLRCEEPLTSEMTGESCAYYRRGWYASTWRGTTTMTTSARTGVWRLWPTTSSSRRLRSKTPPAACRPTRRGPRWMRSRWWGVSSSDKHSRLAFRVALSDGNQEPRVEVALV